MTSQCNTPYPCSPGACVRWVLASCFPLRSNNLNTNADRSTPHLCCPKGLDPPCASIWCRGKWCTDCSAKAHSTLHLCCLATCRYSCPPSCTTVCPCLSCCGLCRKQTHHRKLGHSTAQKCCLARCHHSVSASIGLPGHMSQANKSACRSIHRQTNLFGLYSSWHSAQLCVPIWLDRCTSNPCNFLSHNIPRQCCPDAFLDSPVA
mmetsp:Transcript_48381/g.105481  ORF Transcript_48381/g.105481 Transcript_48381/m.105481 type:complete len:205 (+) Transcript_48381:91-705(+)